MNQSYSPLQLELNNLACQRGERVLFSALNGVIENNDIIHIQGENGIGKTTLLNTLAGFRPPAYGRIILNQRDIIDDIDYLQSQLSWMGHKIALNPALSAIDNLEFLLMLKNCRYQKQALIDLFEYWKLLSAIDLPVYQLSQGQKQRLALMSVFYSNRQIWLLDEPLTALDDYSKMLVQEQITAHANNGGCIVYTSHQALDINTQNAINLSKYTGGDK